MFDKEYLKKRRKHITGIACKPMGKLRKDFKRIESENEREKKAVRKALKGKDKK